jgi:uncharacterized membrane protein
MDEIFDTVAGLPVHPLVIHSVVVLVPLAAVGLIVAVLNKAFRTRFAFALVALIAVTVPLAFIAKESGEALAERVGISEQHETLGGTLPIWVAVLLGMSVVWLVIARRDGSVLVRRILGGVVVFTAVQTIVVTLLVGHSGAEATWGKLIGAPALPSPTQSPTAGPTEPAAGTITAAEVSQHATPDDCWTIIDGAVFDMTPFLNRHPGGSTAIAGLCGGDGTAGFRGQHGSASAPNSQLESLKIGVLATP